MRKLLSKYGFYIIIPLLFLGPVVYFSFVLPFNDHSGVRDSETFSHYGGFIAGVFGTLLALLNALLIYLTFRTQQSQFATQQTKVQYQISQQQAAFIRERFENRFFEMVRTNRAIVESMEYEVPDDYLPENGNYDSKENVKAPVHVRGQKVFVKIQLHCQQAIEECRDLIEAAFASGNLFESEDSRVFEENLFKAYYKDDYTEEFFKIGSVINIAYVCVFYGLGETGRPVVEQRLTRTYDADLIKAVVDRLACKPVLWSRYWKDFDEQKDRGFDKLRTRVFLRRSFYKYYGGHQHRLGHYFRQMFMIVNFVNEQSFLQYAEKIEYIKLLRSQLSTYEQAVFFMNSFSFPGRIWELQASLNDRVLPLIDRELITKYNLVKNIPAGFIPDIAVDKMYPLVEYEMQLVKSEKLTRKTQYQ